MINSAAFGLPKTVSSIAEAVVYLGLHDIKRWAAMLSLRLIDSKPKELFVLASVRAKMCELIAQRMHLAHADSYFLMGLISLLDALLDMPIEEIVAELPVDESFKNAVIAKEGEMGQVLAWVIAYENGQWSELDADTLQSIDVYDMCSDYLESVKWCDSYLSAYH